MDHQPFLLPVYFEYAATFIWATSGAILGARRGFAVMGILTMAMVSSTGGGLLRDGLFLQGAPPALIQTPVYLELIFVAAFLVMLMGGRVSRWQHVDRMVEVVDALGLGGYAAVGMSRALVAGVPWPGVVVIGMVNAVGGGILRDLLLRREVRMFLPGTVEEAVALMGCLLFLLMHGVLMMDQLTAAWVMIATVFAVRVLAIRWDIRSKPLQAFAPYERGE